MISRKSWQGYTEELCKKGLNDLDKGGVATHLEPDILECAVKWALLWTKLVEVMKFQWNYLKS